MQRLTCPHCGLRNAPDKNFCARCEHALHEAAQQDITTEQAVDDQLATRVDIELPAWALHEHVPPSPLRAPSPTEPTSVGRFVPNPEPKEHLGDMQHVPWAQRPTAPWPEGQPPNPFEGSPSNERASDAPSKPPVKTASAASPTPAAPPKRRMETLAPDSPLFKRERPAAPSTDDNAALKRLMKLRDAQPPPARERLQTPVAKAPPVSLSEKTAATRLGEPLILQPQRASAPELTVTFPTTRQQLGALFIDACVIAMGVVAIVAWTSLLSPQAAWPTDRPTFIEALAMWLFGAGRMAWLAGIVSTLLALGYSAAGAIIGVTVGRFLLGLRLVGQRGERPSPATALWHALGGLFGTMALGLGLLWPILDPAGRTWASLTSRTFVVRARS